MGTDSATTACSGSPTHAMSKRCWRGGPDGGSPKRMRKLKPCCIRGVAYPSHAAAAAALGLTRQRIHQLARQPGEDRKKPQGGKPVMIDGTTYASVADAADALA